MDLMEKTLQIHPSDVNSALLCEMRLDETLAEDEPNRDLMRGSVTHYLIERDLLDEKPDVWGYIRERLDTEYGYEDIEATGVQAGGFYSLVQEATRAFEGWVKGVKPKLDLAVPTIEEEHTVFLGSRQYGNTVYVVELVGSPDLVAGEIGHRRIHDWKTAARMWDPVKLVSQAQPPLYSALVAGAPMPFTFWIWDISAQHWLHLSITPTQTQLEEMIETAVRLAIKREVGLLTATPGVPGYGRSRGWWCSPKYCRNWNKCTARHMWNDGNEDVKRDWREDWNG
jgi:PD-(D/E)XK nuclease superfamily